MKKARPPKKQIVTVTPLLELISLLLSVDLNTKNASNKYAMSDNNGRRIRF